MNAREFVEAFLREKQDMYVSYINSNGLAVSLMIRSLNLSNDQVPILNKIIDGIVTDTFYSILLRLDGAASIGGIQQLYKLYDQENNLISDCGEIEGEAYEVFQG